MNIDNKMNTNLNEESKTRNIRKTDEWTTRTAKTPRRLKWILFLWSMAFYLVACLLPAVRVGGETYHGFVCLVYGFMTFSQPLAFLTWCANFVYFFLMVGIFFPRRLRWWFSVIPVLLALPLAFIPDIVFGRPAGTVTLTAGYVLWLASMFILLVTYIRFRLGPFFGFRSASCDRF